MKDMCVQTKNKGGSTDLVDILKFGTVNTCAQEEY